MESDKVALLRALRTRRKERLKIRDPHRRSAIRDRHRTELCPFAHQGRHVLFPSRDRLRDCHVGLGVEVGLVKREVLGTARDGGLGVGVPSRTGGGIPSGRINPEY
jgi:hypothetical protein